MLSRLVHDWWRPGLTVRTALATPLAVLYRSAWHLIAPRRPAPPADGVPTVVVGNWVVGGAGKTPTTLALLRHLQLRGWTPGVISRGYGRREDSAQPLVEVQPGSTATAVGDEPLLLRRRGGVPVVVGRDRVAARRQLLSLHPKVDIVLCDDGLQHRRLHRDFAVIVFDERGIGNGWCLPAGPLRAPWQAAPPPDSLVLYNAPHRTTPWPGFGSQRMLRPPMPLEAWATGLGSNADPASPTLQPGQTVHAAAGIGVPERFFEALRKQGLQVTPIPLPDHHTWHEPPWPSSAQDVVVTEKDAVKLLAAPWRTVMRQGSLHGLRLWVAPLDFEPEPAFWAAFDDLLVRWRAR